MKNWDCSQTAYKREKPSYQELKELIEEYGEPTIYYLTKDMDTMELTDDYPACKGEAVIKIMRDGKVVGVKHRGGEQFVLPQGRVWETEGFIEGFKREASEETGFKVSVDEFHEIRKIVYEFSNAHLERWHLLFSADITGGEPVPKDSEEIEEVGFFDEVPWKHTLY